MNFIIKDVEDFKIPYPDVNDEEIASRFKPLGEYLLIAQKMISEFGPRLTSREQVQMMLKSEDAIAGVAHLLMMSDWRYKDKKGRTEYSYRNQCGIWAIQIYLNSLRKQSLKSHVSLDENLKNAENISLHDVIPDKLAEYPYQKAAKSEKKERIRNYIGKILRRSNLTETQMKCIQMKYFDEIDSYTEIGARLNPPVSRQNVKQILDRAIFKLRQTSLGS